jgi:hypothetical protein
MGYENLLADERTKVATDAAELTRGRGGVFLAAKGGERMKQGVRGMMGIEDPVVTEAKAVEAKQIKLNAILSKYSNAKTRAEFTSAFSELMAAGFPEYAAKIQEHLKNMPKPKEYSVIEGYKLAKDQGYDKSFFQYQIELKQAAKDNNISIGNIPQDFIITTDDSGKITMEVIPGSPTDIAQKEALAAKEGGAEVRAVQKTVVVQDIDRLKKKIIDAPWYNPVAGTILAKFLENPYIGAGKNRIDAEALATTIKSSIGFDRLQQMREESPTGGALGQVSELELIVLQATLGSIDMDQSEGQLLYNLDRLAVIYQNMLKKIAETGDGTFQEKMYGSGGTSAAGSASSVNDDPLGIR